MATVIDSLLIELGIDASKFNSEQKKIVDELKKVAAEAEKTSKATVDSTKKTSVENKKASDQEKKTHDEKKKAEGENKKFGEESTKRAKQTQLDNKNIGESFSRITLAAASFGASLIGLKEIAEFSTNLSLANASLGRTSQLLGRPPEEIQAWGKVFEAGGDKAGAFANTLDNILSRVAAIKNNGPLLQEIARQRVDPSKFLDYTAEDPAKMFNILAFADAIKKLKATYGTTTAQNFAASMGATPEQYLILIKSREELEKLYNLSLAKVAVDSEITSQAAKTQEQITKLDQAFLRVGQNVQESLAPKMGFFRDVLIDIANSFSDLDDKSQKFITNLGSSSVLLATLAGLAGIAGIFVPALLPVAVALGTAAVGTGAVAVGKWAQGNTSKEGLSPQSLMEFYMSKGLDKEHAAALVGNAMQESSLNIHSPSTYKGKGYEGLFQLSPERQGQYKAKHGKEYKNSSWQEMAAYSLEEMETTEKDQSAMFRSMHGVANLAKQFSNDVQRPNAALAANDKRSAYAMQAFSNYTDPSLNSSTSNIKNNTSSVQTGDIHIHTQATEGAGIGDSLSSHLQNLLVTGSWAGGTN
jgi:hypothetical protein